MPENQSSERTRELLLRQVREQREAQLAHSDSLDSKAGVVLGFGAAVVALAPSANALAEAGRLLAMLGALLAVLAFWPRPYPAIDVLALRRKYLTSRAEFAELALLDTHIQMVRAAHGTLRLKAGAVKVAMASLFAAGVLLSVGMTT